LRRLSCHTGRLGTIEKTEEVLPAFENLSHNRLCFIIAPKKVNRSNAKDTDTFLKGVGASRFCVARCRLHYRVGNLSLSHFNGKHGRHLLSSLLGDRRRIHYTNGTLLCRERGQNSTGRWIILVRASGTRKHNRLPSGLVILDRILANDIDRD